MKFVQLTATRDGAPRPVWVNADHIARLSTNEAGGTFVYFALADEKGTLTRISVQETPEQIIAAAQG